MSEEQDLGAFEAALRQEFKEQARETWIDPDYPPDQEARITRKIEDLAVRLARLVQA